MNNIQNEVSKTFMPQYLMQILAEHIINCNSGVHVSPFWMNMQDMDRGKVAKLFFISF